MGNEPLYITVSWDRPEYHGLRQDGMVDWPPSPLRLLGALISGAHTLADDPGNRRADGVAASRAMALEAIQKLSEAPPPTIHAPRAYPLDLPGTYTQKSGLDAAGKGSAKHMKDFLDLSLVNLDTTSRTLKPVDGVALEAPTIVYEVDLNLESALVEALEAAAWMVGYFGRSFDPAGISITRARPDTSSLRPLVASPSTGGLTRGWTPLSVQWYEINYQRLFGAGGLPLPAVPDVGYVQPLHYGTDVPARPLEIIPLPQSVPNHRIPPLLHALLERTSFVLPSQVRLFPVVNAGHPQSDGRCLGIGLVAAYEAESNREQNGPSPRDYLAASAAELAPLVWEPPLVDYRVGPTPNVNAWALHTARWTAASAAWVSATPYRGFPDQMVVEYAVTEEIQRRFSIEVEVSASPSPRKRFEHRWGQQQFSDGLMDWWLELRFPTPVSGPLLLEDNQKFGTGLFVPEQATGNEQTARNTDMKGGSYV